MQANLKLSSKILSKSTQEMVNTCIGKLYKQTPLSFRNGLKHTKTNKSDKSANHGPLEKFKQQDHKRQQSTATRPLKAKTYVYETQMLGNLMSISQKPTALTPAGFKNGNKKLYCSSASSSSGSILYRKEETQMLGNLMSMSQKPTALTPRKLPKTFGFKNCNKKLYCSSASSSSGSILYRNDTQRATRACHTVAANNLDKTMKQRSNFLLHKPISKLNQHINSNVDSMQRAMKVSCRIQRDLKAIDELLKSRIQDVKAINFNKTTKDWQNSASAAKDYSKLKENKQISKNVELTKLTKGIATSLECNNMTSLPIVEAVKPLNISKSLSYAFPKSTDFQDFPLTATDKENKPKINLRKHFRSSYRIADLEKSPKQPNEDELLKPYKLNKNLASAATYSLLTPTHITSTKYSN